MKHDHYITDILDEFKMSDAKVAGTPMAAKQSTNPSTNDLLDKKLFPFAKLIGKLLYCSNCTRTAIAMAVNHLSLYMTSATVRHWEQATRVLRYLSGTRQLSLTFNGILPLRLLMWQDSSFGDGAARKSKTGYVAMMCGSAVAWGSKLQPLVALSTTQAKYMALSTSAQEVVFLRQLLINLGEVTGGPTPMLEDNEGCETLAINTVTNAKTKHIDIRHHFVRDLVKLKTLEIVWLSTTEMIADILTKTSLPTAEHKKHTDRMLGGTYSRPHAKTV